jgi:hypothetical protein
VHGPGVARQGDTVSTAAVRGWLVLAGVLTLALLPRFAWAQSASSDDGVQNQYRLWFIATRPAAELERLVFQAFVGLMRTPDNRSTAIRYSLPPGFIFKPRKGIELWTDSFGVYTANHDEDNSWELRPRIGLKVYALDAPRLHVFNYTRFEYRFVHQGDSTTTTLRLRDRFGIEAPFTHTRPWMTHTWYGLADVEFFWVLNDGGYFEQYRIRAGTGYIVNSTWRAEFIYHAQLTGDPGETKTLTENIWRLNIKLSLPRRGERVAYPPDSD